MKQASNQYFIYTLVGFLKNQKIFLPKGQIVIDLLIFFLIILLSLNFFYLFIFYSINFFYLKANNERFLSLALQASEDIYLSSSVKKDNFIVVGLLDESTIETSTIQYKNFENIFYSFSPPTIFNLYKENQLCLKRFLYFDQEKNKKDFWVCVRW